jgi:hypothetical protein
MRIDQVAGKVRERARNKPDNSKQDDGASRRDQEAVGLVDTKNLHLLPTMFPNELTI